MHVANPFWGAPRIHGELFKLGIDVGQTSVAKYMVRGRRPPSQGWKAFLRNHADRITAMDLFVVPAISFRLLYGLLILRHDRRRILWFGVTAHSTTGWITRQLMEACGWQPLLKYILCDRDRAYREPFSRRIGAMGIRIAAYRRDPCGICQAPDRIDSKRVPRPRGGVQRTPSPSSAESYEIYYNTVRTHLSLTLRSRVAYRPLVAFYAYPFLVDHIINMPGSDFTIGTGSVCDSLVRRRRTRHNGKMVM